MACGLDTVVILGAMDTTAVYASAILISVSTSRTHDELTNSLPDQLISEETFIDSTNNIS